MKQSFSRYDLPDAPGSTTACRVHALPRPSHVRGQVAEQPGVEDALGEAPCTFYPFEAVVILTGQDRVQALAGHLEHGEAAAGRGVRAVDLHRHVRDLAGVFLWRAVFCRIITLS